MLNLVQDHLDSESSNQGRNPIYVFPIGAQSIDDGAIKAIVTIGIPIRIGGILFDIDGAAYAIEGLFSDIADPLGDIDPA